MASILGIHHVTAICGDAQQNLDFYTGVLGLRLVKLTVNFDDPATYHLYYGDGVGSPGSIITFFPYPNGRPGRAGTGEVVATSYAIPEGSCDFWKARLEKLEIPTQDSLLNADGKVLRFADPDGLAIELVETKDFPTKTWDKGPIGPEFAVRGILGVTLCEVGVERTDALLMSMGFKKIEEHANHIRFKCGHSILDVLCQPDAAPAHGGRGTVHHIAFRTPDDPNQAEWQHTLAKQGFNVSPVMDRQYFHSIYFREPGGVLFEIATDPPGFAVDESVEHLGTSLMLPPMYEPMRSQIEKLVQPLKLPVNE